jgi:hypothetical protein
MACCISRGFRTGRRRLGFDVTHAGSETCWKVRRCDFPAPHRRAKASEAASAIPSPPSSDPLRKDVCMAIPAENFVLRLHETAGNADPHECSRSRRHRRDGTGRTGGVGVRHARATANLAGFSILRFDPLGRVLRQISKTLCSFSNIECGNFQLETGCLIPLVDRFIVAGTATNIFGGVQNAGSAARRQRRDGPAGFGSTSRTSCIRRPRRSPRSCLSKRRIAI